MLESADRKSRFLNLKPIALVAILIVIAGIAIILILNHGVLRGLQKSSLGTFTDPSGIVGGDYYEQFASPTEASESFDRMLNQSREYRNFSPCFDDRGNRIGEKVTIFLVTSSPAKTFWRTVWTQRKTNSSDLFYVEAETLDGVLAIEKEHSAKEWQERGWRFCKTTRF